MRSHGVCVQSIASFFTLVSENKWLMFLRLFDIAESPIPMESGAAVNG